MAAHGTNERLHISAYERLQANFDKKVSPYLKETAGIFKESGCIDHTGQELIDFTTIEDQRQEAN